MIEWKTIEEMPRPKCYDRLHELSTEAWGVLTQMSFRESELDVIAPVWDELVALGLVEGDRLTEEGRLAYQHHMDFVGERWSEEDHKRLKSCAAVATDGDGNDILLAVCGPSFDWHVDQEGRTCEALGLDGCMDPGVWVFEGTMVTVTHDTPYGPEYDVEPSGDWRAPTAEEWELLKEDECPWDRENLPRWPERGEDRVSPDDLLKEMEKDV
jgi:hypothetical protein